MNLLERYNQRLRSLEDDAITRLHGVMDASFNRLVRRARILTRAPYRDPAERELALLQEFQQLVPAFRPDQVFHGMYPRVIRVRLARCC
ncbi:hypothetical protein [Vulcanococcus limneticus]|uniref:hypothetical protein n=1 Tax=Vulcanococcus limneticus TaxID=2170428 RepID=UPI00398BF9B5